MAPRPAPSSSTTSRKGGVPHTLREWFTLPAGSTSSDPSVPSPERISHRSISISSWSISTTRGAIGTSAYMDSLSEGLGVPPPEMVFPHNTLCVRHEPSGWSYTFDAERALRCVEGVKDGWKMQGMDLSAEWREAMGGGVAGAATTSSGKRTFGDKPANKRKNKAIKVAYADEWGKSRSNDPAASAAAGAPPTQQATAVNTTADGQAAAAAPDTAFGPAAAAQIADARDYDWTYSTTWAGEASSDGGAGGDAAAPGDGAPAPAFQPGSDPSEDRIPVERLGPSSGEPILFYDDLVLFEDELGDNGSSLLGVKVRVMPSGFLVLQRFFLRVDDVIFRIFDTRVWCGFNEEGAGGESAAAPVAAPWAATAAPTRAPAPAAAPTTAPDFSKLSLGQPRKAAAAPAPSSRTSQPAGAGATPTPAVASGQAHPEQKLIRECSGCEAPYKDVRARLPPYRPHDLSLLTDPGWVSSTLQNLAARQFAAFQSAHGASRGLGSSSGALGGSVPHPPGGTTQSLLAPARLPSAEGGAGADTAPHATRSGATILGEVRSGGAGAGAEEEVWEGVGGRVDVVYCGAGAEA